MTRKYEKLGTGGHNAAHIRVGSWWRLADHAHGGDQGRFRGPRQIASIDRSSVLARVTWEKGGATGRRVISLPQLLKSYVPCAAPSTEAPKTAPKPNGHDASNGAGNYLRDIVREEIVRGHERNNGCLRAIIREELKAALAALRPAVREEALAAVHAAFGETRQ